MLPSMPILFTRDSQDAFGNKIEPSTSFFSENLFQKPAKPPPPPPPPVVTVKPKVVEKETKAKSNAKKSEGAKEPPKADDNALETALVRSYYTKVQSRFSTHMNLPTNKFIQFQNILKCFDPSKESPVDLYKKIEQLFGKEHKDILEEFLLFLKPSQAAEVGRFMDHFMLTQMTGFIELLQTTLSRKPTVLRKVIRALTAAANGDANNMRTRVLPHLRSHPRLAQAFQALFPDEKPPDSANESAVDILSESFLTDDQGYDEWEFDDPSDKKKKVEPTNGLDAVYLHGRVFLQQGRLVRPARVSFPYSKEPYRVHVRRLAPTLPARNTPPASDDEKPAKKTKKAPTKPAKDVNDNTSTKVKKKGKVAKKEKKANSVKKEESSTKKKPVQVEKIETKSNWTREEDKTMLQVLKGEAGSEQTFCRIRELLPHKSVADIKERFCHVMSLLQQMAVGEVT